MVARRGGQIRLSVPRAVDRQECLSYRSLSKQKGPTTRLSWVLLNGPALMVYFFPNSVSMALVTSKKDLSERIVMSTPSYGVCVFWNDIGLYLSLIAVSQSGRCARSSA